MLPVGWFGEKPEGAGFYFEDEHRSGTASRLHLVELAWGRLVDVHALDENGAVRPEPVLRDFVVNENVQTDSERYWLQVSPITQKVRLVIRRAFPSPVTGDEFVALLARAAEGLPGVVPKSLSPSESAPFSFIARNAVLVLRFDDLLGDDERAVLDLTQTVRLQTGYPPALPMDARILFDPNHGGIAGERFHSTRVLIDLTVSEAEALDSPVALALNSVGLPRSERTSDRPNVALRLPTQTQPGSGQFVLLRNLRGSPLDVQGNGPLDEHSPTRDVLRALRGGNDVDTNNGFLLDLEPPRAVGNWPCRVLGARALSADGFAWSLDLQFVTVCRKAPFPGDILAVGETLFEVDQPGGAPDAQGRTEDVRARVLNVAPPRSSSQLLGGASYESLYRAGLSVNEGCWARFSPEARIYPNQEVPAEAHTSLRFSEPMDSTSALPFETILHVRGGRGTPPSPGNLVVGAFHPSPDLREFTFVPAAPFAHAGEGAVYHVRVVPSGGITDLAGNELQEELPAIEFTIDAASPPQRNASLVLRFDSTDELEPIGAPDLRGQFTYDFATGTVRPRPVVFASQFVDSSLPVLSIMTPFLPGVATPLSPLGSKLQTVWRYADMGWSIRDETKYNLDVVGACWSPARGHVLSDFFERFEVRLAHSVKLPDEPRRNPTTGGVKYPLSGLSEGPVPYADNVLDDPLSPQKIVNEGSLGYRIDPADLLLTANGNPVLPFPINRGGGELVTYTWRDTAVLARGGHAGAGVPLDIEVGPPLYLENASGTFAPAGEVPSVGLPLLMEFRCYPSESAVGLNPLSVLLASNISAAPNFRAFSTGGINIAGQRVTKNPDLEPAPTGGFNPGSRPPGRPTLRNADNTVYLGQLDYVVRISRAHTIWLDTHSSAPRYTDVVVEPPPDALPPGTEVRVEFRGADGFFGAEGQPFDARALTPYGDPRVGTIAFHAGDPTWKESPAEIDGARFFQMRFTFVNNVSAGFSPELSSVGVGFSQD